MAPPYLCRDIISDILMRVPADDVVRYKTVSKLWRSLIYDPKFIISHFRFWQDKQDIIFSTSPTPDSEESKSKTLLSLSSQSDGNIKLQTFPTDFPSRTWHVKSSCDGLLLILAGSRTLFVCNPVTRRCNILPDIPIEFRSMMDDYKWILCRDALSEKYKVFAVIDEKCIMLTQGNSSWTQLESGYSYKEKTSTPIYLNNKLHWVQDSYLVSFDVATMEFSGRDVPVRWGSIRDGDYPCLYDVNGSLCLLSVSCDDLDIFVLERISSDGTWKKRYSTKLQRLSNVPESLITVKPLGGLLQRNAHLVCMKNFDGTDYSNLIKLITVDKDDCLYYDFKRQKSKKIEDVKIGIQEFSLSGWYHYYFGTLVSW